MKPLATAAIALSLLDPFGAGFVPGAAAESELRISRPAARPVNDAPAQYFTGAVRVEMLHVPEPPARASAGSVSFSPGARTHWHTHPLGQTLIVTAGVGRVQRWGGPVDEIRPGDVVRIPPGIKHWHGAAPDSGMTHLALTEQLDGKAVDWLEAVSAEQYLPASAQTTPAAAGTSAATSAAPPSRAQQLFGDVAPKLADLTDQVLFGDVWARPGLSRRDRSLVTVSALIAMNRPDQLRSHLALARQNGLSQDELVEALTHLAFYAGWPSAVSAAGVAKDVFAKP